MGLNANLYQLSAATCCLSIALGSATLNAAEPAEGYIVSLDKKELIINLGPRERAAAEALHRAVSALGRDPPLLEQADRRPLPDRLRNPSEVGQKLSIVTRWNQLTRAPQRGDIAVFRPPLPTKPDTPKPLLAASDTKNLPPDSLALQKVFRGRARSTHRRPHPRLRAVHRCFSRQRPRRRSRKRGACHATLRSADPHANEPTQRKGTEADEAKDQSQSRPTAADLCR